MKKVFDAKGMVCPLPVVNAKEQIKNMNTGDELEVLVDNEIAVQNLCKFAKVKGFSADAKKIKEQEYSVTITLGDKVFVSENEEILCTPNQINDYVVAVSSQFMGEGNDDLGKALMKSFIFALTKQDVFPKTILFYNSGAFLTSEGSDCLEDINYLQANGVEVLTCGTCMNFYGITEKLAVGSATNMYDIVEILSKAGKVIKP